MSGQSITDRIAAAQHSVTGSAVAKAVCKATTHEVMGPKKKHLDYLTACTNEINVSIPQLADTLFERAVNSSWVVVFKALVTTHHLMCYGNERFIQYLASRNTLFNLANYVDKSGVQGYDMSTFIRRYSKYLNEKAYSYRQMAFDFTRIKRGVEGVMRTMNTEKLLKTLPIVQSQLDALLDFEVTPNDLTNGVINSAFMLLFKDLIRLFACYNDGIINLLEKYFEMNKKNCKEALDLYKKFLTRMTRVSEFLKVAECVGIDKGDIPDLTQAPSSLLDALEQHLASLEGKKTKDAPMTASSRSTSLSTAVSALSTTGMSLSRVDEQERRAALDEEQARLNALKRLRELGGGGGGGGSGKQSSPASSGTSPNSTPVRSNTAPPSTDLFSSTPPSTQTGGSSDLFGLQPNFGGGVQGTGVPPGAPSPWTGFGGSFVPTAVSPVSAAAPGGLHTDFDAVFGNKSAANKDALDSSGDILQPMVVTPAQSSAPTSSQQAALLAPNDLDSSLANLVGNLAMNPAGKKEHQWTPAGEKKLTGGHNWQPRMTAPATWAQSVPAAPSQGAATMAYPTAVSQPLPTYGMMGVPMVGVPVMGQQPMLFAQPGVRPTNPFGPVPGTQQMQFM